MAANQVLTAALGRVAELYRRVDIDDPSASTIVVVLIANTGIESDATLKDKTTLDTYVSGATNEATNTGYTRKVLTQTDLVAWDPDEANDWVLLDLPDQTWTAVANDGTGAIAALLICYDPSSSGVTASVIEVMTQHAFSVTPDGSDITAQLPNGFYKAS